MAKISRDEKKLYTNTMGSDSKKMAHTSLM